MCGVAGYFGQSKDEELTHRVMTRLFSKLEVRGADAAGCWGHGDSYFYHKLPVRSSQFVRDGFWGSLPNLCPSLLLAHTRRAIGSTPRVNKNNHPFVSKDRTLALIHNGWLPEYPSLRKLYEVVSECDSEVLLRIIEAEQTVLDGIREVFASISQGHMAVAVGCAGNLYLFRNAHRSLWLIDVVEDLNQHFFCSTYDLWKEAAACLCPNYRAYELPPDEVWHLTAEGHFCYEVSRTKGEERLQAWRPLLSRPVAAAVSPLDDNDEPVTPSTYGEHGN